MPGTKKQYLRQLNRALRWRLAQRSMIQEVVSDYAGFFDDGIRAGRSEAELCAQFGPPNQTARELSRAEGFGGRPLGLLAIAVFALAFLLDNVPIPGSLICLGQVFLPFLVFRHPGCVWFAGLLIPLLWVFWRNAPIAALPKREKRRVLRLCIIAMLLWLVSLVFGYLLIARWQAAFSDGITPFGRKYIDALCCVEILLAAVLLLSLLRAWRKSFWYLIPAACCQGVLAGISRFLSWQSTPSYLPLLSGFLAAVLCAALTAWLIRHGRAVETRLRPAMRTEGDDRSGQRLALLVLWPPLALWLTRGFGPMFDWSKALSLFAAPLLLPLLCLFWRGVPKGSPLSGTGRRELAVLMLLPLLFLLAFAGLTVYVAYIPETLAAASPESVVYIVYIVLCLLTAFAMLPALVKSWLDSPAFLLPAAHCVGVLASLGVCVQTLAPFDPSATTDARLLSGFAAGVFTPYALGWLWAGIALLMQKWGNRHGRAA